MADAKRARIALRYAVASLLTAPIGVVARNYFGHVEHPLLAIVLPTLVIATAQWSLALRNLVGVSWLLATVIVGVVGDAVMQLQFEYFYIRPREIYGVGVPYAFEPSFVESMLGIAGVAGVFLGAAQWFSLCKRFGRAGLWVIATAIGAVISWSLKLLSAQLGFPQSFAIANLFLNPQSIPALFQALVFLFVVHLKNSNSLPLSPHSSVPSVPRPGPL